MDKLEGSCTWAPLMNEGCPFLALSLLVVCAGDRERGRGASQYPLNSSWPPSETRSVRPWCGEPSATRRKILTSGFSRRRALPAPQSSALSRRRRCRTSVSPAAAAPPLPQRKWAGTGRTREPPLPHLSPSRVQGAVDLGRGSAVLSPSSEVASLGGQRRRLREPRA